MFFSFNYFDLMTFIARIILFLVIFNKFRHYILIFQMNEGNLVNYKIDIRTIVINHLKKETNFFWVI
jgi:hypothetical protein